MQDSLFNLVTALGTSKDKSYHTKYGFAPVDRQQLLAAYRGDWIARKVVSIPAMDSTREWRAWQADKSDITAIEKTERRLGLKQKLRSALIKARLFGGAALVIGVGRDDASAELDPTKIVRDGLSWVHDVSRHEISSTGQMVTDVSSPWYGRPEYYEFRSAQGTTVRAHPSRVAVLRGVDVPDRSAVGLDGGWGDSVLQAVDDAIKNVGLCSGAIATMVWEAKLDVIKIPNLMASLSQPEYEERLKSRLSLANEAKSFINALVMDKEEDWERIQQSFVGLPDVLKLYLLIASGAADIPVTRFLGQSPAGLNSTGESDIRNYYDRIKSDQVDDLQPALEQLDDALIASALGKRPEDVYYDWRSLWQLDDVQKADLALKKAQTFQIDANAGGVPIEALGKARANQLIEDGTYPGLEDAIAEAETQATLDPAETDPQVLAQEQQRLARRQPPGQDPALATDATPRSLYVRRDLLNARDLIEWAKSQGFSSTVPASQMHVTVLYSKQDVDWIKMGSDDWGVGGADPSARLRVAPGGPRLVERLGPDAVVLLFSSTALQWRHEDMVRKGASHDYEDYQPHVTITYEGAPADLSAVEPYRGELVLGPEIFEEVNDDYRAGLEDREDSLVGDDLSSHYDPNQPRDPAGKWTHGVGGPITGGVTSETPAQSVQKQNGPKPVPVINMSLPVKGNSAERVAMRAALKAAKTPEERKALQERIVQSFKKDYDNAVKKGNLLKAAKLDGKMAKYAGMYGVPKPVIITTTTQANAGYTASEIHSGGVVAQATAQATGKAGSYTPAEMKAFNDLAKVTGEKSAKTYSIIAAKSHYVKNGVMTPAEGAHITAYTGSHYASTNNALRTGKITVAQQEHVNQLNAALSRLPDYKGTVYRKTGFKANEQHFYKPGTVVEERAFTSTSSSKGVWSGELHFEITSATGKLVRSLSLHPHEDEVLFRSGTKFRVISNNSSKIHMEEIHGR